jgi:hypothetical protein
MKICATIMDACWLKEKLNTMSHDENLKELRKTKSKTEM